MEYPITCIFTAIILSKAKKLNTAVLQVGIRNTLTEIWCL